MRNFHFVATAFLIALPMAQAKEYKVDPSHSNIGFTIRHLVSKVSGEFKDVEATLQFDVAKPSDAKLTASVKAGSINTNNEKRDNHLKSADFFDVEKFPALTFESKKISAAGRGKYKMTGDLTIHGTTKPVTFDVEYLGEANDPWGMTRAGFTGSTKVNRKDFGMSWNKALDQGGVLLGEEVTINLNIEGILQGAEKK